MRRAKTRKNRAGGDGADAETRGGGFLNFTRRLLFVPDNNLVHLMHGQQILACPICKHDTFQLKLGTIGVSKAIAIAGDILFGESSHDIIDTSIASYFCDECGYGIIVRDQKFNTTGYRNKLTSIPAQ